MKATLFKSEKEVKQMVDLHQNNIKGVVRVVKDIHTKSVHDSIENYEPNRVLQATPPQG